MVLGSQKQFGKLRSFFKISEKNIWKIFFLGNSNRNWLKIPNVKKFSCSGLKMLKSTKSFWLKNDFFKSKIIFYSFSRIAQELPRTIFTVVLLNSDVSSWEDSFLPLTWPFWWSSSSILCHITPFTCTVRGPHFFNLNFCSCYQNWSWKCSHPMVQVKWIIFRAKCFIDTE